MTIAIIGAGLGGLSLALDLKRAGISDFVIYERDDNVGGTWYNNGYPGCRCDVKAIWYSHSRFPNPDWSEAYPPRSEIWEYWHKIAIDQDLVKHVKFHHKFLKGEWHSSSNSYLLSFEHNGETIEEEYEVLVSSVGGFSTPAYPDIKGLDDFSGEVFHSARWPKNVTVDTLKGKTIGVVGNGCSGTQIVTALSREPEIKVVALARTPQWLLPPRNYETSLQGGNRKKDPSYSSQRRSILHMFPFIMTILRAFECLFMELGWFMFPLESMIRKGIQTKIAGWMKSKAPEHLKEVIVPDYPLGGKRIIRDAGYLKGLRQPNVTAVWDSLASVKGSTVTTSKGQTFELDYLALATGFSVVNSYLPIVGRNGTKFGDFAKDGANVYHGIAIPNFPNYFLILGSNTAPTHASVIFNIECQANYITQCILKMRNKGIKALEIRQDATDKYMAWLDNRLDNSVWAKTKSWYRSGDGTGRCYTNWPGTVITYWWQNRRVKWADWVGTEAS